MGLSLSHQTHEDFLPEPILKVKQTAKQSRVGLLETKRLRHTSNGRLREGCRASSHPVRLKESSGVSSLPEKRPRVTLESIAVPSPTGALPPSTANNVFLSLKKLIVSVVPPIVKPLLPRVCLEAVRLLDGFLGESLDEKGIGES